MRKTRLLRMKTVLSIIIAVVACSLPNGLAAQSLVNHVDPFIGTGRGELPHGHLHNGNTHPGAQLPWGMVSLCPMNIPHGTDKPAPSATYRDSQNTLYGLTQVNLSGVGGLSDLGTILLTPTTGQLGFDFEKNAGVIGEQSVSPGFYRATLPERGITLEATATMRAGLTRISLPAGESHIILNLANAVTSAKGASVRQVGPREFEGMRMTGGFCWQSYAKAPVFFVMQIDRVPTATGLWKDGASAKENAINAENCGAYASFQSDKPLTVLVKVGVSYTSIANARANLDAELPGWDFEATHAAAAADWEEKLGRVRITGGSPRDLRLFYTALYHSIIHPNVISDINGDYPAMNARDVRKTGWKWNEMQVIPGTETPFRVLNSKSPRYSVFSLWDTYRTVHPLLSLLYPKQQTDMVRSMLGMFEESGELPKWELIGNETHIMVGDPAAAVVADTWMKGLRDFDPDLAWRAIAATAFPTKDGQNPVTRPGLVQYLKHGYIPNDAKGPDWVWGSVATTLEYAVADFAAAQFARAIGKTNKADELARRSLFYRNLYDRETGFLRARLADGSFIEPFDPLSRHGEWPDSKSPIGGPGYVEGNAWHYTFFVPHDIPGYAETAGPEKFAAKLEECFAARHYDPSNEPDIAYAYAFNRLPGHEPRASHWVREIINTYYGEGPGGLPGNDDCGTLSAWLVFSMLGLYPDVPGLPEYSLVAPHFPEAVLHLQNPPYSGETVTIRRTGSDDPLPKIDSITWNGRKLDRPFLSHADLVAGGTLTFSLGK